MSKFIDLTNMKFGRLTVIERVENAKNGRAQFLCLCDCGNEKIVQGALLRNSTTQSCGCLQRERASRTDKKIKHGMEGTPIYNVWRGIKERTLNQNCKDYPNYGGRNISMLPAWRDDFRAFYNYVSQLEHFGDVGFSLDRIDNNGNYEPGNLRWADRKTQNRNTRFNHFVEYNGELMCLADAAEKTGICKTTLFGRVKRGDTGDRLFRPVKK